MKDKNIKATMYHDEGAMAQCSFCKRYSDNYKALIRNDYLCNCGKAGGWTGSFKKPTETSLWNDEGSSNGIVRAI